LGLIQSIFGGNYHGGALPYVRPPVYAACPAGLKRNIPQSGKMRLLTLDPSDITGRFFNPTGGPTNLFGILQAVDDRVSGINGRISSFSCMNNAPTSYQITNAWVTMPTFYAQCSELWSGNAGFDQWGIKDGTFYLYVRGGETTTAATISNYNSSTAQPIVNIWTTVGIINRSGSHGVIQVYAGAGIFEMSIGGNGFGFCGAQLKSDTNFLSIVGSLDMGATCQPTDTACCYSASLALAGAGNCTSLSPYALPALGRQAYGSFGASQYPGTPANQVVLSTSGTDAVDFGPSAPAV